MNPQTSEQNTQESQPIDLWLAYRYKAAKIVFVICTLLFFINYFLVGAWFYADICIVYLPYTYVMFDLSFLLCTYFLLMTTFQWGKKVIWYALFAIFAVLFMLFLLPVVFKENVLSVL